MRTKRMILILVLLLSTVLLSAQGGINPSFQGMTFPALIGQTGSCDIVVFNANAKTKVGADSVYIYKPYKCEFFPEGSPTVISKDSILLNNVTIYLIPVGKFHFKLTFHNGLILPGDCQIGTKLPDGRVIYVPTVFMKYPDPLK